jgi:hypothetical protein
MPDIKQSFEMKVKPHYTTADIQDMIAKQTGLPVVEQVIKFKDKEMSPKKTMMKLGLKENDTVQVKLAKVPVTIKSKKNNCEIMRMMVDPMENLLSIKQQIAASTSVPPHLQTLSMSDGVELTDVDKSAKDLGIKSGTVLFLDGDIIIESLGDIYVALTLQVEEAPKPEDYQTILTTTEEFYAGRLREVYPDSFKEIHVKVRHTLWNAKKPNEIYNVYIEWDLQVHFDMSGTNIPNRNKLCTAMVQTNLMPYMQRLMGMPKPPFNMTRGAYTKQTK